MVTCFLLRKWSPKRRQGRDHTSRTCCLQPKRKDEDCVFCVFLFCAAAIVVILLFCAAAIMAYLFCAAAIAVCFFVLRRSHVSLCSVQLPSCVFLFCAAAIGVFFCSA